MTVRARRAVCQALIWVVLAGALLGSLLTWVRPEESRATQVATQVTILVAAIGAIFGLAKLMPPLQIWPQGNAVGELRDGGAVVGRVVRVGSRHLVCLSDTTCRVLHVSDGHAQQPVTGRHLTAYFPAGASGIAGGVDRGVEAKVVAWGPGLRGLGRPKLAVLRTVRPLPSAIPRLTLARHPHRGRAHVLLADPDGAPSAAAGPTGTVNGTKLTITQVLPPDAAGAPVLAGDPDANPDAVVAFVAAEAGSPIPVRPPGTGCSVHLVAADDAQLLLDSVNRRQALKLGALGVAGLAVGGGTFLAIRPREHLPPRVIKGAGWNGLFDDPQVRDRLSAHLRQVPDLKAPAYTYDVKQMSGVESVNKLTPRLLREYDFVTAPNDVVRERLETMISSAGMTPESTPFFEGSMVLLVRRNALQALQNADLLTTFQEGETDEPDVRFDVQTYLRQYSSLPTWKEADRAFDGRNPGDQIKIDFSDPTQAGGGELFLAMLRQAQIALDLPGERGGAEWLWGEDGPLYVYGAKATGQLLNSFLNGGSQKKMVFVYEHDVIAAMLEVSERAKNYVILRTSLEAVFTQFVISITPAGGVVREALAGPLAETLFNQFRVRANRQGEAVERLLASPVLAAARKPGVEVTRSDRTGQVTVKFRPADLKDLVSRMSAPAPTSP